MQSKNAIAIVHAMTNRQGMNITWNIDVGYTLKYI